MSGTDYRALCAELLDEVAARPLILDRELIARARAALAAEADGPAVPNGREPASVVGEPSDEDLLDLAQHHSVSYTMSDGTVVYPLQHGSDMRDDVLSFARAVLARFGNQPAPAPAEGEVADEARYLAKELRDQADDMSPSLELFGLVHRAADLLEQRRPAPVAEGEVAELVALIRQIALACEPDEWLLGNMTAGQLARAADLLERQAAPVLEPALARINDILNDSGRILQTDELEALELARQALEQRHPEPVPVAVSERLPEAGDCLGRPTEDSDAGWCWTYSGALEVWRFQSVVFPRPYPEPPRVTLSPSVTHWLPHHALPLPAGEVE